MYIQIGSDMAVRDRSILGIFDLDNTTCSKHTRNFLAEAEKNGQVITVDAFSGVVYNGKAKVL